MSIKKCVAFCFLSLLVSVPGFAQNDPPPAGGLLPEIVLAVPKDAGDQAYLGLSGKETFQVPEIKARLVIIQIFSMY